MAGETSVAGQLLELLHEPGFADPGLAAQIEGETVSRVVAGLRRAGELPQLGVAADEARPRCHGAAATQAADLPGGERGARSRQGYVPLGGILGKVRHGLVSRVGSED